MMTCLALVDEKNVVDAGQIDTNRGSGQTVFSDTHVANPRLFLVVGSNPELQDTSFWDHLPSAAPSVR